jgi:histidinol dehydrogenase
VITIQDFRGIQALQLERERARTEHEYVVATIIEAVRKDGDAALLRYAKRLDDLGDLPLKVSEFELAAAGRAICADVRTAVEIAVHNIREFAQAQLPRERFEEFSPGRKLGWIVRPLDAVGCYIPSGRYPLPSTLLMTAVLAQVAGVHRICITSPRPSIEMLACAYLLGIKEVYRVGGAQAIAAMAVGTTTIARVDRIVGPGNAFVAAAKKLLAGEVGIDFVAGPTEVMILADDGDATVIAADMLAQAEHDTEARAILITCSERLANGVRAELESQGRTLSTREVAREAIDKNGRIYLVPDMDVAVLLANMFAPEHLCLHDPSLLPKVKNAGAIFLGPNSPESAGDYAAGPSHVLPTGGWARLRGGLSTADFVKIIAVQQLSRSALQELAPVITTLARAEGLEAHARSVEARCVH